MNKSTLPVGIKTMIGWKNKGTLTLDNPIQRSGSQWTLLQKSLLIHSILMGYPIPNCYFLKTKDENGNTVYDCLDAKQRLTSVFDFVEGEYELHSELHHVLLMVLSLTLPTSHLKNWRMI